MPHPSSRILLVPVSCLFFLSSIATSHAHMVLVGTALKKFLTFPVVTVSLYIEDGHQMDDALSDIPKQIEVNYHLSIPKRELDQATLKGIRRNYSRAKTNALLPQIHQINSYYPDVKAGDQITVTYIPGHGCEVRLNGTTKGLVPGADFAKAFFSIWVGKNPVDVKAKYKLLGKAA